VIFLSNYPNSQYIAIKSDGTVINYYYHGDFGICSSVLSSPGKWNNAVSNADDAKKDYSVGMDVQDTVYIIYRNKEGSIKVILHNGLVSKTMELLRSKSNPDYNMFPQIIPSSELCHVFYIIENAGKKIICHQTLKSGKPLTPVAIDYIKYDPVYAPYSVANTSGRIFLLYTALTDEQETPGYKIYDKSTSKWSKLIPLTKPGQALYSPFISSCDDRVLITYVKKYEDATYIITRSLSNTDGSPLAEQETLRCTDPDIFPKLLMLPNENIIHWREDRQVKYVSFFNSAKNPSLRTLEFADRNPSLDFNVIANINQKLVQGWLVPGNFSNGLTLGFIQIPEPSGASRTPAPYLHETKSSSSYFALSDEYKVFERMQGKIADLEKKIRQLSDRISALEKNR
jgi:hypothetical protein